MRKIFQNILLLILSISVSFGLLEVGARALGLQPGNKVYKLVDRLEVTGSFKGNSDGSLRADPSYVGWKHGEKINKDGFRGPELPVGAGAGDTILLVGDSFAWGGEARPITLSFSDLLRERYKVANLGIPGVGPTQYKLLVNEYVDRVNPDVLILQFYMGNDLKEKPDPMRPDHPLYWVTNAGWIWAYDKDGKPFSPEQAYKTYVYGGVYTRLRRLVLNSAVLSQLYFGLQSQGSELINSIKGVFDAKGHDSGKDAEFGYTFETINEIADLAKTKNIPFLLIIIPKLGPNCHGGKLFEPQTYPEFRKLNAVEPKLADAHFTAYPGCHLNNAGHQFVAKSVEEALKKLR